MINFFKKQKNSFLFLNTTQFLGALNDNIFKLLVIFFLIHIKGQENANIILSLVGVVFVLPFLLFSAASGVLADRLSKRNIIVSMKVIEAMVMILSIVAIFLKSEVFIYLLLFLMATQSSIFGPSKYGIIPEIVPKEKISKANGILTSFTYLAIIIGTFLASLITDITNKNFIFSASVCVLIGIAGYIFSLRIEKTAPKCSEKKISIWFFYEIYKSLKFSRSIKYLFPSILGVGFFLFIGGFVQLNTIPFAIQSLHISEIGGGYLFLSTAFGIALGALLAGKISKEKIELGLSCIFSFLTSFILLFLGIFPKSIFLSIFLLVLLGICGGLFLIPFETFLQFQSPHKKRGQIIAASNFLSFLGVLFSALFLYFLSEILDLSAASGFSFLGILVFIFAFFNTRVLFKPFIEFLLQKVFKPFYFIEVDKTNNIPKENAIIFIKNISIVKILSLYSKIKNLKIITKSKRFYLLKIFIKNSVFILSKKTISKEYLENFIAKLKEKNPNSITLLESFKEVAIEETLVLSHQNNEKIFIMQETIKTLPQKILNIKIKQIKLELSFIKMHK